MRRRCEVCLREFYVNFPGKKFCSERCQKKSQPRLIVSHAHACTKRVGLHELQTVDHQSAGISDARWRIELRRRANPEYYSAYGVPV